MKATNIMLFLIAFGACYGLCQDQDEAKAKRELPNAPTNLDLLEAFSEELKSAEAIFLFPFITYRVSEEDDPMSIFSRSEIYVILGVDNVKRFSNSILKPTSSDVWDLGMDYTIAIQSHKDQKMKRLDYASAFVDEENAVITIRIANKELEYGRIDFTYADFELKKNFGAEKLRLTGDKDTNGK